MIFKVCSDFVCSFRRRQLLLCRPVNGATKDNGDEGFINHLVDLANEIQESSGEISHTQHGGYGLRSSRL
jgi:hypothetical protein